MSEQMMERAPQSVDQKAPALTKDTSIWDSSAAMATAVRMAEYISNTSMIPQHYQRKPGECLFAIDLGRRMGLSPFTVMQNSQIVNGNFSWKGAFCKDRIDTSGLFTNSRYEFCGNPGAMDWGCRMVAENARTHRTVTGPWVTMQMAKDEKWLDKNGSKWRTMPELMMRYRAAAFFARTECPQVLSGYHTAEEIVDIQDFAVSDESEEPLEHPEITYSPSSPAAPSPADEEAPEAEADTEPIAGGLDAL